MEIDTEKQPQVKTIDANEIQNEEENSSYIYGYKTLYTILGCVVLAVGIVATLLCRAQVRILEQEIIVKQQNNEQAWVEVTLENFRTWRNKVIEPVRYVTQAEMFRLFAIDVNQAVGDKLNRLKDEAVVENEEHELHSMHEELKYLAALLADTVKRRKWYSAKIMNPNGIDIISLKRAKPLDDEQKNCLAIAKEKRSATFSPIYEQNGLLMVDIIEPMYEVLSDNDPKIVGFLLVTIPMDQEIKDIFADRHLQDANLQTTLLTKGSKGFTVLKIVNGRVEILPKPLNFPNDKFSFAERKALVGENRVYSQGGKLANPLWWVIVEKDFDLIDEQILGQAKEIYGLGVLGSLAIALVIVIIIGTSIARNRAREGQKCIDGLVHAIECSIDGNDPESRYLQGRSDKILRLSKRIGQIMKLSGENIENIQLAARLSQVGKIFVPRDIMAYTGVLSKSERLQAQLAPYHAYNVLRGVLPGKVALIVYQMGGNVVDDPVTGENHKLTAKEMLLEARVLLVANNFCAMVSQRGGRPPLPLPEARKNLEKDNMYDRAVVAAVNSLSDSEIKELLDLH